MKRTVNLRLTILAVGLVLTFTDCQKMDDNFVEDKANAAPQSPSNKYTDILGCLGFDDTGAQELDNYIIVENCMMLHKSLLSTLEQAKQYPVDTSLIEQRQHALNEGGLININKASQIRYYVDPLIKQPNSIHYGWLSAINQAIYDWKNVNYCRVNFTEVTTLANSDLAFFVTNSAIAPGFWSQSTTGLACFPYNGNVGRYVGILASASQSTTSTSKRRIMIHEIGHTLGLRHSCPNGESSSFQDPCQHLVSGLNLIQGTPACDEYSIMKPNAPGNIYITLNDAKAVQYMYPDPYPTPTIINSTVQSCSNCASGTRTLILYTNTISQPVYRVKISRYNTAGTLLQTYTMLNAGTFSGFSINCPIGTWKFKISRENFGQYKVESGFYTKTIQ